MAKNKYDAIILRTPQSGLTRDNHIITLQSMKDDYISVVDLAVLPNPCTDTCCVLFITEELLSNFDYYVSEFVEQYKSIIDNVNQTYEGTLAIEGDEYLIKIQ